jgi:DNA-binding transcriptional regulator YiaG
MSIKSLIKASGMTQKAFAEYFHIPLRSIENWSAEARQCPQYLIDLIAYKLKKENIITEAE